MGHTTNPEIRIAKSVVDYIFRWLGIEFMAGFRERHAGLTPEEDAAKSESRQTKAGATSQPEAAKQESTGGIHPAGPAAAEQNGASAAVQPYGLTSAPAEGRQSLQIDGNGVLQDQQQQFAGFQTDAPTCDNCGSITVRNGNCHLCYSCGNSMGCS